MLSENFKKLLEIQMERYDAILKDCDPFTSSTHEGDAALHQRIVKDVRELKNLTGEFMEAAQQAQTNEEKVPRSSHFQRRVLSALICGIIYI